ncbi:ion transporter [Mariprofundus micogutta]|nr:ion transporter [Mariprofundus micogutta]
MLFEVHSGIGKVVNLTITLLIVVSVLISMTGTLKALEPSWVIAIEQLEYWVTVVFAVEFVARCYSARNMRAYLFSFYGMVDMLAILPMLLIGDPNIAIRLLRIVRLLKLVRYLRAMRLFISSMRDTLEMLSVVVGSIALGAILSGNVIYALEPETFSSAFDGAWWGIVTMTTVGYGDVVPHTLAGRAVAVCLMVIGICMFAAVTAIVSVKIARALHHGVRCHDCNKAIAPEFPYCPYCASKQQQEGEQDETESQG